MAIARRSFLQGLGLGAATLAVDGWPLEVLADPKGGPGRALVVIQLTGGNDGLNTVAPLADPLYRKLRPKIGLDSNETLELDGKVALHNALVKIHTRFKAGQLAIIQGVGYPKPSRSHFDSTAIWQMARLEPYREPEGWLGRALSRNGADAKSFALLGVGGGALSPALYAKANPATALASLDAFSVQPDKKFPGDAPALVAALTELYAAPTKDHASLGTLTRVGQSALASSEVLKGAVSNSRSMVPYPRGPFGDQLKLVAQLLAVELGVRVAHLSLGSFDTHANQKRQHQNLLSQLSEGVTALLDDLESQGLADRVVVMTYSEFGRRVAENGSGGTDHGGGSVLFLAGKPVRGGLHGTAPELSKLQDGDVPFTVDFRSVYASVLEGWLQLDAKSVLGASFPKLPLFASM